MMSEQGRDHIEGNVGDEAQQAAIGSNIKQDTTVGGEATGNIVNIYGSDPIPSSPGGRSLPLEIEREFRARFDKISEKLEANTLAVAKLEGTLDRSNILTQQQIDTLKSNQRTLEELAKETDAKIVSTLAGLHIVAAPTAPPAPEPRWMPVVRLVFQAITALGASGLLVYFYMGG
jgi:hypothetical protein